MLKRRGAPAKLNWSLEIRGRRPDSFHELRSWFFAIDLRDELRCRPAPRSSLRILASRSPFSFADEIPADENNLVLRAETRWRAAGGEAPPLAWTLRKRIPSGAGLGGGSADAAAALDLLEEIATRPLGPVRLASLAAGLGSDLPFFLGVHEAEFRGGRGELLLGRAALPSVWIVLAIPPFPVPTPLIYGALEAPALLDPPTTAPTVPPTLPLPPLPGPNDLEGPAHAVVPELEVFSRRLGKHGPFRMSGSGGAHFLPLPTRAAARALSSRLRAEGIPVSIHRPTPTESGPTRWRCRDPHPVTDGGPNRPPGQGRIRDTSAPGQVPPSHWISSGFG